MLERVPDTPICHFRQLTLYLEDYYALDALVRKHGKEVHVQANEYRIKEPNQIEQVPAVEVTVLKFWAPSLMLRVELTPHLASLWSADKDDQALAAFHSIKELLGGIEKRSPATGIRLVLKHRHVAEAEEKALADAETKTRRERRRETAERVFILVLGGVLGQIIPWLWGLLKKALNI